MAQTVLRRHEHRRAGEACGASFGHSSRSVARRRRHAESLSYYFRRVETLMAPHREWLILADRSQHRSIKLPRAVRCDGPPGEFDEASVARLVSAGDRSRAVPPVAGCCEIVSQIHHLEPTSRANSSQLQHCRAPAFSAKERACPRQSSSKSARTPRAAGLGGMISGFRRTQRGRRPMRTTHLAGSRMMAVGRKW